MARSFLRVRGELWADGSYHPLPGWETKRLVHASRSDTDLTLMALDASGDVVARGPIQRHPNLCVSRELRSTDSQRLIGYVVHHPKTAKLVLALDHSPIFTADVAAQPPQIHQLTATPDDDGSIVVAWTADHNAPLTFNLLYLDPLGRAIPVADGLRETRYQFHGAGIPGGEDAAVALIATDGIRSSSARSTPFPMPDQGLELCMIAPQVGYAVRQGHPFSLIGHAQDQAGRALPDAGISWLLDDETVVDGTALACAQIETPGEHTIAMLYRFGDRPAARVQRTITVVPEQSSIARS